ncbi:MULTISPECIES: SMP-30/gluconolactonase/LRE family protein [unclassified Arcicella]|uniref:SMP-30/gluconolactonase/LRE family protein n=1 Tax=unclassified Arcicella TaxID=2644986 RepID=UPI0028542988|nr:MULTISPECIES: SMP-30/gluconolactonase/LRE family protein [unclassified Arcicella]MDR6562755.1 sugar lactone lactonase YvrE [Arcicella sp. BE51]MDR6812900.1 sugar lactone lactonase YvrE [Arcicella sp. BE140]MDR6824214.1 sugar lactone lactonase YvrE [Arcicella sp. BE139]
MKNIFRLSLLFVFVLSINSSFSQVTLKKLWESDTTSLLTPESILFEPKSKTVFVSCINGGPAATNSNSYIAKVDLNGKVTQQKFTENLQSTKGLGFLDGKLYVTEIFKLVEIDAKSGKVLNKYDVPDAKFLNDIGVDTKNKIVYFTDMRSDRLWKLDKGQIVKVVEGAPLKSPNGLFFENGKLIAGNGDGKILAYDLQSQQFSTIAEGMGGIDGILTDGKKGYFASEWRGKVWHINTEGKTQLLLDFVDAKVNTADFEYIPSKKLLIIPTFLKNKIMAYGVE